MSKVNNNNINIYAYVVNLFLYVHYDTNIERQSRQLQIIDITVQYPPFHVLLDSVVHYSVACNCPCRWSCSV